MPPSRFEPSSIKNKIKREEVARKSKKTRSQQKLQKRLVQAKLESKDPALKKVKSVLVLERNNAKKTMLEKTSRKCAPYT